MQGDYGMAQRHYGKALELKPTSTVFAKAMAAIEAPLAESLIAAAAPNR